MALTWPWKKSPTPEQRARALLLEASIDVAEGGRREPLRMVEAYDEVSQVWRILLDDAGPSRPRR